MKAKELMRLYAQGERNFQGANLRGESLQGQKLDGADFSHTDIRGTNFAGADLNNTKFVYAKAGLPLYWITGLAIFLLIILSILVGFCATTAIETMSMSLMVYVFQFQTQNTSGMSPEFLESLEQMTSLAPVYHGISWFKFIALAIFLFISNKKSLVSGIKFIIIVIGILVGIVGVIAFIFSFLGTLLTGNLIIAIFAAILSLVIGTGYSAFLIGFFGVVSVVLSLSVIILAAELSNLIGSLFVHGLKLKVILSLTIICIALIPISLFSAVNYFSIQSDNYLPIVILKITLICIALPSMGFNMGWRSLKGDMLYRWVKKNSIAIASIKGTNFQGAVLKRSDFSHSILNHSDFRNADLKHVFWFLSKRLDEARVDGTILENDKILNLLVNCSHNGISYEGENLRNTNLTGANLKSINFKSADLNGAILKSANLEYANLSLAQAIGTCFIQSKLTGASLEAWNIDSTTQLAQTDCSFVYLLEHSKPGTDDRERRPSSGIFGKDEFTKLFQEVLSTIDFIFRQGVDWMAFVAAFKRLKVQNQDTELSIQSIENKGDGVVVVRVDLSPDNTNKEKIHREFITNYDHEIKAIKERFEERLQGKSEEIKLYQKHLEDYRQQYVRLEQVTRLLASKQAGNLDSPITVNVQSNSESQSMSDINDQSISANESKQTSYDLRQSKFGGGFASEGGIQIGGHFVDASSQEDLAEAAQQIQKLLDQLSKAHSATTPVEKTVIATKAVEEIEKNPILKQRITGALQAGGTEALKELVDHPAISILLAALDGWQSP